MTKKHKFDNFKKICDFGVSMMSVFPYKLREACFVSIRHIPGLFGLGFRYCLIKRLARSCGTNVVVFPGAYLTYLDNMKLGNNISIHEGVNIGARGGLNVGNDVMISQGTSILTHEHDYVQTDLPMRDAKSILRTVNIGNDVWIGANSIITAGVQIGDGTVVGAGSVVTKSIPNSSIAYGVPARVVKQRSDNVNF